MMDLVGQYQYQATMPLLVLMGKTILVAPTTKGLLLELGQARHIFLT
jgi:hypothetical protein